MLLLTVSDDATTFLEGCESKRLSFSTIFTHRVCAANYRNAPATDYSRFS